MPVLLCLLPPLSSQEESGFLIKHRPAAQNYGYVDSDTWTNSSLTPKKQHSFLVLVATQSSLRRSHPLVQPVQFRPKKLLSSSASLQDEGVNQLTKELNTLQSWWREAAGISTWEQDRGGYRSKTLRCPVRSCTATGKYFTCPSNKGETHNVE